jgi:hypothetical protein
MRVNSYIPRRIAVTHSSQPVSHSHQSPATAVNRRAFGRILNHPKGKASSQNSRKTVGSGGKVYAPPKLYASKAQGFSLEQINLLKAKKLMVQGSAEYEEITNKNGIVGRQVAL